MLLIIASGMTPDFAGKPKRAHRLRYHSKRIVCHNRILMQRINIPRLAAYERARRTLRRVCSIPLAVSCQTSSTKQSFNIAERLPQSGSEWQYQSFHSERADRAEALSNKKDTARVSQLDFDVVHQYTSPCHLQASLTRSVVGMQHTACGILPNEQHEAKF